MSSLKDIHNIYFIGIGGIGMSALATYFHNEGKNVSGYDKTPSDITQNLEAIGIDIHYSDRGSEIQSDFLEKKEVLVIYTPAVPKTMGELTFFRESGYLLKKRAEVLGMIANQHFSIAVAGTHGKTTTSSILGHILAASGEKVTAFVGGITNNYQSNLIQKGSEVIVVEADEFDRSFLQLKPNLLCITSMDADHLDIYENETDLINTFEQFGHLVDKNKRFIESGLSIEGNTLGIDTNADYTARNITIVDGYYRFDLEYPGGVVNDLAFGLPGRHNLFNAITAFALGMAYGTSIQKLKEALATYSGVNRRFTYRIKSKDLVLIDDYAHHPTEIEAVNQSVREMYPKEDVLAIFQPHLYTRTRDFMADFAVALSRFDEVILLNIYPAREEAIDGITSAALLNKMTLSRKQILNKEELSEAIRKSHCKIITMMGAGDIGVEILKITKELTNED